MTVAELIKELEDYPLEAEVYAVYIAENGSQHHLITYGTAVDKEGDVLIGELYDPQSNT